MKSLANTKVKPPVKMGQVIVANILGTGADLVATDELPV
jgi:CxxC motif-containing protein